MEPNLTDHIGERTVRFIRSFLILLITTVPLFGQSDQVNEALSALQKDFSNLSNVDIKYAATKSDSIRKEEISYINELKVRNNFFWFSQIAKDKEDSRKNFSYQLAYNGKLYQKLDGEGHAVIESRPYLTNIQSLATTPLVRIFPFMHPSDWHTTNAFEFLNNPQNWLLLASNISNVSQEVVNGANVLKMTVKATNGVYETQLRPDLNYLPTFTRTVNGVGFPVTIQCASFRTFNLNGTSVSFPTEITDEMARPNGTVVVSTKTTISSITPLTTAVGDNSDFQIDTASAASILDEDIHKFIKTRQ